ncbi:hypothetical protein AYO38_01400 [bacterium SCGC AG-212-C10]|nr:hypothetical protein AYO38_01400 [bacterium SCGC AG-212-C10]
MMERLCEPPAAGDILERVNEELRLRNFAEQRRDGMWYVHCIDLCLDAEADTYSDARTKLDDQIVMHLEWALETAKTPRDLLRPSPLEFRLRYRRAWLKARFQAFVGATP